MTYPAHAPEGFELVPRPDLSTTIDRAAYEQAVAGLADATQNHTTVLNLSDND